MSKVLFDVMEWSLSLSRTRRVAVAGAAASPGGEIGGRFECWSPPAKITAAGYEPLAGEPRSRETASDGNPIGG